MHEIWICNPEGMRLAHVDSFSTLSYTRVVNGIGRWTASFQQTLDAALIRVDGQVQIWRALEGRSPTLEMCGFIRTVAFEWVGGVTVVHLGGTDLNDLLRRRIVAYATGTSQAHKVDHADDMMKAIVRENLGASATDSARDLSALGFRVQEDNSLGPSIEKAFAWRNVLEVLQEISDVTAQNGTPIYFDTVWVAPGVIEFRTYAGTRGKDRRGNSVLTMSDRVLVGPEFGNLEDAKHEQDFTEEKNYIYAGGQGEGSDRVIKTATDEWRISRSVWNRCEDFVDARNCDTEDGVENVAQQGLVAGEPRREFTGQIVDTAGCRYGIEWGFGDLVQVDLNVGSLYGAVSALIRAVTIEIDHDGNQRIFANLEQYE